MGRGQLSFVTSWSWSADSGRTDGKGRDVCLVFSKDSRWEIQLWTPGEPRDTRPISFSIRSCLSDRLAAD